MSSRNGARRGQPGEGNEVMIRQEEEMESEMTEELVN